MKYFISFILGCFIFLSSFVSVSAQTVVSSPIPTQTVAQSIDANSQKMEFTLISLLHTITCIVTETPVLNKPCFSFAPLGSLQPSETQKSGGLLGMTGGILSALYSNPPVHAQYYVADISRSFGLIPEAHAQQIGGAGSQVISGVYALWQVSRNFAYILMTMIFVVIGVMVMFRQRINPQTVITLQAALPGLVVGLILITLSYFFASVLVDIGFVAVYLVGFYFMQTQAADAANLTGGLMQENVFKIFSYFISATDNVNFVPTLVPIFQSITGKAALYLDTLIGFIACEYGENVGSVLGGIPFFTAITCGAAITKAVGDKAGVIGLIASVVLLFILLYTMLQIIRKLVTNYITILFLTFSAPFHFLVASMPGQEAVATAWARNMLCNVLAFPGVFGVFYFAAYVLADGSPGITNAFNITTGMKSSTQALPFLVNLDSDLIRYLVGFGSLIAAPTIPDLICDGIGKVGRGGQVIAREIESSTKEGQGYLQRSIRGGSTAMKAGGSGITSSWKMFHG